MADLKRLSDYFHGYAMLTVRDQAAAIDETARILSVLAALREGCRVRYAPEATNAAGIALPAELEITGPATTLRALAELLEG